MLRGYLSIRTAFGAFIVLSTFIGINTFMSRWHELASMYPPTYACNNADTDDLVGRLSGGKKNVPRKTMVKAKDLDLWLNSALVEKRNNETWLHIFGTERKDIVKGDFLCRWKHPETSNKEMYVESKAKHNIVDASWPHWGPLFACRFTCQLPEKDLPEYVQLVSKDSKIEFPEMLVEQGNSRQPKDTLAVCVKPMTGPLKVYRLVEWFETLRAAGLEHFIMYHTDVFGNGRYVFEYYQQLGILDLISFPYLYSVLEKVDTAQASLNGQDRYAVYQQVYLAAMQDCLYRYKNSYKYILFMDLDEILLPIKNETLSSMVDRIEVVKRGAAGFLFLTAWHFEEFGPKKNDDEVQNMYIQKFVESTEPIDNQPKCVVNTHLADSVNFHGVVTTRGDKQYVNAIIPWTEFGYLHHFRGRCDDKFHKKRCDEELLRHHRPDPVLLRYRDLIVSNTRKVIDTIDLH